MTEETGRAHYKKKNVEKDDRRKQRLQTTGKLQKDKGDNK